MENKSYLVSGWVEVELYAEVEAKNLKSAIIKAKKLDNSAFDEASWSSKINDLTVEEKN